MKDSVLRLVCFGGAHIRLITNILVGLRQSVKGTQDSLLVFFNILDSKKSVYVARRN